MSVATSYHRTFLAILVVAITVAFVVVMRSFLITIMLAAIFTGMVYPGYRLLLGWCRGRQRLAAAISILVIVLLVVLPSLALIGVLISQGIQISNGARSFIQQEMFSGGWTDRLQHIPFMDRLLPYREQLLAKSTEVASAVATFVVGRLSAFTRGTVAVLVQVALMFYAMYFFLMDGRQMLESTAKFLPLSERERTRIIDRFTAVSASTIKSTVVIGIVQGTLGGIGFAIAGVPGAAFWGFIMVVLAMIPGIGTALVWVPAAVYLALIGRITTTIIFAAYFILVVGLIDNLLRPRLVGKESQMHELLVLLSTLGGIMAFGLVGFIIGPVIASLFITLWSIQSESVRESDGKSGNV